MDFMCPDTWISDVDFINILIKKLIINAVPFTDSISVQCTLEQQAPLQNALCQRECAFHILSEPPTLCVL